jgi:hypothetical protein
VPPPPDEPPAAEAPAPRRRRGVVIGALAALAVVAVVLGVVLLAGGDDDPVAGGTTTEITGTTPVTPAVIPLTQAEYRDAANAICRDLPDVSELFTSVETPEQLRSVLQLAVSSSLLPAAVRLGALDPPLEWEPAHQEILAAVGEEIGVLQGLVQTLSTEADPRMAARIAARRVDELTRLANGHWQTFGATDCVEDVASPSPTPGGATGT